MKPVGQLQPTKVLFHTATRMLRELWDHRLASGQTRAKALKTEHEKTQNQIEKYVDRIVDTDTPAVVAAIEERIRKLEQRKIVLSEKMAQCGRPVRSFDETLRTSLDFLGNPQKLWASERLEDKRAVLKLTFADRLAYVRNEGFRTPILSFPIRVLADLSVGKVEMARHRRWVWALDRCAGRRRLGVISLLASRKIVVDPTLATFDFFRQRAGELSRQFGAVADHVPPDVRRGFYVAQMDIPDDKTWRQ
jgi:hypothetical protein